ncbi:MAG TPA: hypothetical protein VE398_16630 [Acidobacteriota bacterium]|nr:hypothetical protein [Acidobacteriota bacterium]
MKRRQFLASSAVSLFAPLINRAQSQQQSTSPCKDVYAGIVRAGDELVPDQLARQERNPSHPQFGGLPDGDGIYTAGGAAGFIKTLTAAFCAPESRYSGASELVPRMEQAACFLRSIQHADGTIDLHTTNFHSPPDTAFVVEPVAVSAAVLQTKRMPILSTLLAELRAFLRAAGDALAVGGIHTPNHRWVVCAALARLNSLWPQARYVQRIDDWLAEGIDIDADGQYTEHSTSIYSPVVDSSLMTVARLLSRPSLLDPVRRNLEMTLYYLHADGEVATEGSRRQDQYVRGSALGYYLPCRYLAIQDSNSRFAALARKLESGGCERLAANLIYFLEDPELKRGLPASGTLPEDFARVFGHSSLARVRRGAVSATILASNPVFFSFRKGSAALQGLRLASAFFGKGQFQGGTLEADGNRYSLAQTLSGPYYQPLPADARREDGDWSRMDMSKRSRSEVQTLESKVTLVEQEGRFEIEFAVTGCDRVPVAVELGFRRGGQLKGAVESGAAPDVYWLAKGTGRYESDGQVIEFGPGQQEHRYFQIRGALPKLDGPSVYLSGFTPFRKKIFIA